MSLAPLCIRRIVRALPCCVGLSTLPHSFRQPRIQRTHKSYLGPPLGCIPHRLSEFAEIFRKIPRITARVLGGYIVHKLVIILLPA